MRPPGLVAWIAAEARYLRSVLVYAGYRIRPYDMLADRRRWRWQHPQRCGLPGNPAQQRALVDAFREGISRGPDNQREWLAADPAAAARLDRLMAEIEATRFRYYAEETPR